MESVDGDLPAAAPEIEAKPGLSEERLSKFSLDIASGMLESLGLNMYTSIGKSLSEFVANAFDADATRVDITIPFDEIDDARAALREEAKAEVAAGKREKFTVLVDPLPGEIQITIRDNGHGMSPTEIRDKLLVVSRNRRRGSERSESGVRFVMGRKGLGKLAGFGTAQTVTVRSKRAGTTFSTEFTMDYQKIEATDQLTKAGFDAQYTEELEATEQGTTITLSHLRCDSIKASEESVMEVLAQNFSTQGSDFSVYLNGVKVAEPEAEFEYHYPTDGLDKDGFGTSTVVVNDMFSFPVRYLVRFRARETDKSDTPNDGIKRGSLPTALRGARIYCNGRLAAGPTLLKLHTGMHNFHSQAYMECIVHADEIDRQTVDHIGTNRSDLKGDSEIVEALRDQVTELMRVALYEHSKFRDGVALKQVEEDPASKAMLAMLGDLSPNVRASSKRLLQTLAATQGVKSKLYQEAAPLLIQSMNTSEVLTRLMELEHDPLSIPVLGHNLLELARIENADVLKLYRGRRRGIEGLRKLIEKARASWKKGKRFENELQLLLKDNPWLIGPEFTRYLTSDRPLGDVAKALTALLKVDENSPPQAEDEDGEIADQDNRPDLVFVMSDSTDPNSVVVVELKTPNYPLRHEHLVQLQEYMLHVGDWLTSKSAGKPVQVRGFLIGDIDPAPQATGAKLLAKTMSDSGPLTQWQVLSLHTLLERAKVLHLDAIEAAEANESFFAEELSTDPVPTKVDP